VYFSSFHCQGKFELRPNLIIFCSQ
jgi:hypothetical protein